MDKPKSKTAQKKAETERRLATALKRNMLRRKAQSAQREELTSAQEKDSQKEQQ